MLKNVCDDVTIQREEALQRQEEAAELAFRQNSFESCGVGPKFFKAEIKDLLPSLSERDRQVIQNFIEKVKARIPAFLWLCGPVGTGKTALVSAILKECVFSGARCKYTTSDNLMHRIKKAESFSTKESVEDVREEYNRYTVAAYDEVGRTESPKYEQYEFFNLVNNSVEYGKSAIFSTNMTKQEFADFLGNACLDRFNGLTECVSLSGESYRGTEGELYKFG